jgi:hypothetical protein
MEMNHRALREDVIEAVKYRMTPMEAVEGKICMRCKQQVDGFHAIVTIFCMVDYLETGLCATCRNQHIEGTS